MKAIILFFTLIMSSSYIYSQSLTKQESLDELKNTLQGQMIHYYYGEPCSNNSGSSYKSANAITINSIKYEYSQIIIEYSYEDNNKTMNNIKRINMNNYFVIYRNGIFESKQDLSGDSGSCKDFVNLALAFDDNTTPAQERCLKILNYLKGFAEKDPFDN